MKNQELICTSLRRNRSDEAVQPRRQGEEPLLLQQAGRRVRRLVGFLRQLLLQVVDAADAVEELPAALDLAADEPRAKGELVLVVDLEGAEEEGGQGGGGGRGGEGVEEGEGVHGGGDVVLEEGAHLVHGDAEEEEAVGADLAAFQAGDVQEAADAGFAGAEDAVEAEAAVAEVGVEVGDYLGAERDALARVVAGAGAAVAAGGAGYGVAV